MRPLLYFTLSPLSRSFTRALKVQLNRQLFQVLASVMVTVIICRVEAEAACGESQEIAVL